MSLIAEVSDDADLGPAAIRRFAAELERRFAELGDGPLPPHSMANLFRYAFRPDPRTLPLLNVLHKYLLKRTIEHARRETDFYAGEAYRFFAETDNLDPPDLSVWPIISRATLAERFNEFLARDVSFASVCHTSGSTGQSLNIYKSREELRFLWVYYQALMGSEAYDHSPCVLSFPNVYHGAPVSLPSPGKVFISGVTDDTLIRDALQVLQKTYRIDGEDKRISIISGLSFHVKFFTSFLIQEGYEPRDFNILSMNIVGEYVSNLSRRFLAEAWDALIFERFTLTESVAGADRCLRCGWFHFDPHVIAEVVDPDTCEPLEEGVGYLVLTQLYPFVQIQPLVRYNTGDLVRKIHSDCRTGVTFSFLGKTSNCLAWQPDGQTEWLIYSVDLFEIINEIPDIRQHNTFPNVRSVHDTTLASPPIYTQSMTIDDKGRTVVKLAFELRYAPHYYKTRVGELYRTIRGGLLAAQPNLARRVNEGRVILDIKFVGPGALDGAHRIKV